jgi:ribonuclease T
MRIKDRCRQFLPVVVDVETAGFDPGKNALLEIALVPILLVNKVFTPGKTLHFHVEPFRGAELDQEALAFNQIQPDHPFRFAETEETVCNQINEHLGGLLQQHGCRKAILVGHNAHFDLSFVNAAYARTKLRSPFHHFTCLDTATLSALAYGETVLAKALYKARIPFNIEEAHSAIYDTEKTAELFCRIFNHYPMI